MKTATIAAMVLGLGLVLVLVLVACGGSSENEAAGQLNGPESSHDDRGTNNAVADNPSGIGPIEDAGDSTPLKVWIRVNGMTKVQGIT
ncbi:MAG: hypothetical protein KDB68_09750 [Planctomycetes bacterium]|nr:hypothetical protein [Planctomycetota bacterium]